MRLYSSHALWSRGYQRFKVWSWGHSRISVDTNCVPGLSRTYSAYGSDHPLSLTFRNCCCSCFTSWSLRSFSARLCSVSCGLTKCSLSKDLDASALVDRPLRHMHGGGSWIHSHPPTETAMHAFVLGNCIPKHINWYKQLSLLRSLNYLYTC